MKCFWKCWLFRNQTVIDRLNYACVVITTVNKQSIHYHNTIHEAITRRIIVYDNYK